VTTYDVPDALPVLSRGKHRNPRRGACFMETASVLANEKWSDRPSCTDPLLAHLARMVNDLTSDAHRGELAVLIPDVIGVRGDGVDWDVAVAGAVAAKAIYDAPESSQRALAVGLLRCLELAGEPTRADVGEMRAALARVPLAERWARELIATAGPVGSRAFHRHAAPAILRSAVQATFNGTVPDTDAALRELLRTGIETARRPYPRESGTSSRSTSSSYDVPNVSSTTTPSEVISKTATSV
jgi:hypothetical protein